MIQLVIALIVLIATVVLTVQTAKMRHGRSVTVLLPGVAIAVVIAATSCVYSLDVGEVAVIRNLGGSVLFAAPQCGREPVPRLRLAGELRVQVHLQRPTFRDA